MYVSLAALKFDPCQIWLFVLNAAVHAIKNEDNNDDDIHTQNTCAIV